jgi:hypothetical protein
MEAGTKMVLPVRPQGPHIVHDITPTDESNPGEFVKLVVPTRSKDERRQLLLGGYKPLDSFITDSIGYSVPNPELEKESKVVESGGKVGILPLSSPERRRPRQSSRVIQARNLHRKLD